MTPLDWLPPPAIPFVVLVLRTVDLTLSTFRMLAIVRGRPVVAWILGFVGALFFVTAIAGVLSTLSGWSLLAYAVGYASGSFLGVTLERRLAPGRSLLRIFTPSAGEAVAEALHKAGLGATWIRARQRSGDLVLCYIPRRALPEVSRLIATVDPASTITSENVRWLRGGWHV